MTHSITTGNACRNHPLLPYDGPGAGYFTGIMDRIIDRLEHMLDRHSRVLVAHLIVLYPVCVKADEDNASFLHFIEEYRRFLAMTGYDPHYVWVREKHVSPNPHYHLLLLLNGNQIRYCRSTEKAGVLWGCALSSRFRTEIPPSGLIHMAPSSSGSFGTTVLRNDPALKKQVPQGAVSEKRGAEQLPWRRYFDRPGVGEACGAN